MASHIPFAYSTRDARLTRTIYGDSDIVRVSLDTASKVTASLDNKTHLWVDGAVDGFDYGSDANDRWDQHIRRFQGWNRIGDPSFHKKPASTVVDAFVRAVLDECVAAAPHQVTWLSVPQLPAIDDSSRNTINRALAEATAKWRVHSKFRGKLILPVILTHQRQTNLKVNRTKRVTLATQCFQRAGADGYWVVETSLQDQSGAGTFATRRFPGIISFHREIANALNTKGPSIAGPYWALNLVLWARGLITHPAIGLGAAYQYHIAGGKAKQAKNRIALSPLRRWAAIHADLRAWFDKLPQGDPGLKELIDLKDNLDKYDIEEEARKQIARFYKAWFDTITSAQQPGRAFALYQDFSTAYVLGRALPALPEGEGTARRPERIAEQFMLQCL